MAVKRYDDVLVWFRRDLRAYDHAALYHALRNARRVHCAFLFDTDILEALPRREDRRVHFIHESLKELRRVLQQLGGGLPVLHGRAQSEIPACRRWGGVRLAKDQPIFDTDEGLIPQACALHRFLAFAARGSRAGPAQIAWIYGRLKKGPSPGTRRL